MEDIKNILELFLKLHPETKKIFLPIDQYQTAYKYINNDAYVKQNCNKVTLKEFYLIYLSGKTLYYSFKKLLQKEDIKILDINKKKQKNTNYEIQTKRGA